MVALLELFGVFTPMTASAKSGAKLHFCFNGGIDDKGVIKLDVDGSFKAELNNLKKNAMRFLRQQIKVISPEDRKKANELLSLIETILPKKISLSSEGNLNVTALNLDQQEIFNAICKTKARGQWGDFIGRVNYVGQIKVTTKEVLLKSYEKAGFDVTKFGFTTQVVELTNDALIYARNSPDSKILLKAKESAQFVILGGSKAWFHVVYAIPGTGRIKHGYVLRNIARKLLPSGIPPSSSDETAIP